MRIRCSVHLLLLISTSKIAFALHLGPLAKKVSSFSARATRRDLTVFRKARERGRWCGVLALAWVFLAGTNPPKLPFVPASSLDQLGPHSFAQAVVRESWVVKTTCSSLLGSSSRKLFFAKVVNVFCCWASTCCLFWILCLRLCVRGVKATFIHTQINWSLQRGTSHASAPSDFCHPKFSKLLSRSYLSMNSQPLRRPVAPPLTAIANTCIL